MYFNMEKFIKDVDYMTLILTLSFNNIICSLISYTGYFEGAYNCIEGNWINYKFNS